jgi:hypothetical protein
MRILLALVSLAVPQGKPCVSSGQCAPPLQCVQTRRLRATCEQICHPSQKNMQGDCPQDQRCVKDGEHYICRPAADF